MKTLRRLSYVALAVAFAQIVFGAIVRITGSGWGCGDHWPQCDGKWVPPFAGAELMVEVSHRYGAVLTTTLVVALVVVAWRRRALAGVGARGGVLRSASLALGIVVLTALFGAVTIKLRLDPFVIVGHLALAMSLLATLVVTATRAGGFGAPRALPLSSDAASLAAAARSWRVARVAAVLAFVVLVLGALTANLGAGGACLGFPTCRVFRSDNSTLVHVQLTHRVLAFLFALHVLGAAMMIRKRPVAAVVKRAAWLALGAVVLQIVVAAALVETTLPPVLRSLHQAVGTLVWIAVVVYATLASRAAGAEPARLTSEPETAPGSRLSALGGQPVASGRAVSTPPSVRVIASEPDVNARLAELERAARAYESAMSALVAEAEASAPDAAEAEPPAADAPPVAEPAAEPPSAESREPRAESIPPVALPETAVTPAAPPKRPHSVAVIVARGADF